MFSDKLDPLIPKLSMVGVMSAALAVQLNDIKNFQSRGIEVYALSYNSLMEDPETVLTRLFGLLKVRVFLIENFIMTKLLEF